MLSTGSRFSDKVNRAVEL